MGALSLRNNKDVSKKRLWINTVKNVNPVVTMDTNLFLVKTNPTTAYGTRREGFQFKTLRRRKRRKRDAEIVDKNYMKKTHKETDDYYDWEYDDEGKFDYDVGIT